MWGLPGIEGAEDDFRVPFRGPPQEPSSKGALWDSGAWYTKSFMGLLRGIQLSVPALSRFTILGLQIAEVGRTSIFGASN